MMRYSIQPRDIQAKKILGHDQQSPANALKTSLKRVIQKAAEATGGLTGNEIANRIIKVSRSSPQSNSETITNEHNKEILKERYISPEERQNVIEVVRLIQQYNNGVSKNDKVIR